MFTLADLKCVNLHIEKNPHSVGYQTAEQFLNEDSWGSNLSIDPEEKEKAIKNNEIWTIQWYPNTPIGFYSAAFSSLEALLLYAESVGLDGEPKDRFLKH